MATAFQALVCGHPPTYARQAADAAFRELDRLELEFSRFIESSDIGRINRLAMHGATRIGDDTFQCLLNAMQISALTDQAFDPAYLSSPGAPAHETLLALDLATHTVTSLIPRLTLDLGAVGKGYALDRMAEVLREWDLDHFCLQSGGSTVLGSSPATDPDAAWPVAIGGHTLRLSNQSASASGITVQGTHIVDPLRAAAATRTRRTWAFAPSAAESDALSTAFFVMSDAEITTFCAHHHGLGAAIMQADETVRFCGVFPAFMD